MRRKLIRSFMMLFLVCSISGCSNETVEEWADQTMENVIENAESQGIHIDVPLNTGTETASASEEETTDNTGEKIRYAVGETVSMVADNSAEINVTVIDWGNYYDRNTNENLLYVSYTVENIGTQDINISDGMFNVYADDYSVDFAYPIDVDDSSILVTLSSGRKMDSTFYAKINPDTTNNLEVEYGNIIIVLKGQNESVQIENVPASSSADTGNTAVSETTANVSIYDSAGMYVADGQTMSVSIYSEETEDGSVGNMVWTHTATETTIEVILYKESDNIATFTLSGIDYKVEFFADGAVWYDVNNNMTQFEKTESYQS